ncbi:hypothetical protein BJ508DRAFT_361145 [Ascobolus immersus RN42]|uniref:Uncharacterized protein n=1 Tax=Ascobolus immersus RN42 TaxID=1160509 RepID=A0A3N4I8L7_ASCIM|nr:hypothetical protein BJ508DRAFT_361145 [Ascobolus immersus RN42]
MEKRQKQQADKAAHGAVFTIKEVEALTRLAARQVKEFRIITNRMKNAARNLVSYLDEKNRQLIIHEADRYSGFWTDMDIRNCLRQPPSTDPVPLPPDLANDITKAINHLLEINVEIWKLYSSMVKDHMCLEELLDGTGYRTCFGQLMGLFRRRVLGMIRCEDWETFLVAERVSERWMAGGVMKDEKAVEFQEVMNELEGMVRRVEEAKGSAVQNDKEETKSESGSSTASDADETVINTLKKTN